MLRKLLIVIIALSLAAGSCLHADEVLLEQFYGDGVHAYCKGDYFGAYDAFNSAIKGGTNDPRAYYFRGLTYLKLGRDPEAKADFQAGAELEAGDSANVYPVDHSLERVQGKSRQILEQYRNMVHAAAVQRKENERQARYEQRAAAEQEVLRKISPTELPSNTSQLPSHIDGGSQEPNPPSNDNSMGKPSSEPDKNPFEPEPSKPANKTAPGNSDNPFGGTDESQKPAASTPPQSNDNPFGTPSSTPLSTNKGAGPAAEHGNNGAVQPTAGGLGSLIHAVVKGSKNDQPISPNPQGPLPGILQGIFTHGQNSPPGGANPSATPAAVNVPAQNANPPAEANPANNMPQQQPATQPMPPAGTPQQNNPAQPPKDNDNPFN